ncbi:MAG: hypothetical protein R2764_10730 [Bacteroidales bacterium]
MCTNSSKVEVSNSTFKYNKAHIHGGSIACVDSSNIVIKECLISHSEAHTGGGIYIFKSHPQISKNTIHSNMAAEVGGGLHADYANFLLSNSEFYLNSAQYGSAIEMSYCYADMDSLLVHNNTAESGAILMGYTTANLLNSTVRFNTATVETGE